ncbi:MscS Mechanosensitive ion channel [Methanococcus vannielii SB]|uniref:MscS Mechanosensitive ion channel n=1 Tax=Methanococcus vannielii (strain ATCC 35089 / DSM 1224 / JCM 13029 / OCM 148 / SB) TaxID=406327 RepID=A6USV9_METVS|nr:mechanosensitive ion channel family protein [Methanococcus vannielii]ABR55581.1 MscS Mechanosensitive ion channel [Methanococcus vannielii SB]
MFELFFSLDGSFYGLPHMSIIKLVSIIALGLLLSHFIEKQLKVLSENTKHPWILNEDTAGLVSIFILAIFVIFALNVLEGLFSYEVFGFDLKSLIYSFLIIYFSYRISNRSKRYLLVKGAQEGKFVEYRLKASLFNYLVMIIAFGISFQILGLTDRLGTLLVAGGITGIILGFASQTVVSNFISGIFLYFDKPLKIGDSVEIGNKSGMVNDIKMMSTRIRTWDGVLVRIPNEKVFNSEIINNKKYPARRAEVTIGIAYKEDIDRAVEIIVKVLREMTYVLVEPEPVVFANNLGDSSVDITVRAWAPTEKWLDIRKEMIRNIKKALDNEKIEIPFPQRTIWFPNDLNIKLNDEKKDK